MSTSSTVSVDGLVVHADDDSSHHWPGDGLDRIAEIAASTLRHEGVAHGELYVALIDKASMEELNSTHMGHAGPTDVLSFPMDADEPDVAVADGPPRHLGDIVICPDVVIEQAPTHAGTVDAEFALLTVHGVLHILGHDHAEPAETALMQEREREHLRRLGFTHPIAAPEGR